MRADLIADVLLLVALALVVIGVALIFVPAAFIAGGVGLAGIAWRIGRNA